MKNYKKIFKELIDDLDGYVSADTIELHEILKHHSEDSDYSYGQLFRAFGKKDSRVERLEEFKALYNDRNGEYLIEKINCEGQISFDFVRNIPVDSKEEILQLVRMNKLECSAEIGKLKDVFREETRTMHGDLSFFAAAHLEMLKMQRQRLENLINFTLLLFCIYGGFIVILFFI